ncbi:hypothetical protein ACIQU4_28630 [Streptomyces sp. NPDC090741]|uniref:hypothetical protein n=1 Tax=Streptomyces sp. NPDC090741 TaxID=3365967 RepID=UPI003820F2F8
MPSSHARSTATTTAWPSLRRQRDESATWAAVSRALEQAGVAAAQFSLPAADRVRASRGHLTAARFLYHCIAARYVADARTGIGRAWRRRQVRRSVYTRAFEQAESYLFAVETNPHVIASFLPPLYEPADWFPLPLLDRRGRHRAASMA